MTSKREFYVDFEVKHGKTVISVEMPASASVRDLKAKLEEHTRVRAEKQRLLLNLPVMKEKHRDPPHDTPLRLLFPAALVERCEQHEGAVAQHLKVSAMLLGSAEVAPSVNVAATTEISRLVATTVEHDGKWYRCSYSKGYLRQTAYVCRSCIDEGRADPQHCLCLACAEFCHGDHEVEEWGVRHYMRCDCCTEKCWRPVKDTKAAAATSARQPAPPELRAVHTRDVEQRTMRKRSRSRSPLTPKRSRGGSPMSGIRMTTIPPADMPELELHGSTAAERAGGGSAEEEEGTAGPPLASTGFPPTPAPQEVAAATTPGKAEGGEVGAEGRLSADVSAVPALPQLSRCAFVLDSKTNAAPLECVLPTNKANRYPRDPLNWCYCKTAHPSDDPECGGIACLLCSSCYWSTHITKLFTAQYRRMPCYGDVLVGDTVAFRCNTCSTYVCPTCRYRCHKDHDIAPGSVVPSAADGTDNSAIAGANFSCGCRGLCSIAESVPAELIDDESSYALISDTDAMELINNDVFTGFVCAYCMQEHPWLATEDPIRCYHGQLPPPVQSCKPVIACGAKAASPAQRGGDDADVLPYHGMLLPVNAFTADTTCPCAPCRAAYESFAPRALEDATEMIMELHDNCDNCGKSIRDQQGFMCRTCEMNLDTTFFICRDCNALRQMLVESRGRGRAAVTAGGSSGSPPQTGASHNAAASVAEGGQSDRSSAGSALQGGVAADQQPTSHDGEDVDDDQDDYHHDLSHDFIEDTFENLYALCGMQMLQSMDPETQQMVTSNWSAETNQVEVANTLSQSLGQIPLQFSDAELREMATLNQQRRQEERGDRKNSQ